ncbi:cytochrome b5 [Meredithblackwellia eburnea MCA 4105]
MADQLLTSVQNILSNPTNLVLLALAIHSFISLLPTRPSIPTPSTLPSDPSSSYNWRPPHHSPTILWTRWKPEQLRQFDGTQSPPHDKIMFAIRRKVYDVTSGRNFYGPGGPYAIFAGRDASRGLAKQSFEEDMLTPVDEPIDDLHDLSATEWDNLRDWECQSFLHPTLTLNPLQPYTLKNALISTFLGVIPHSTLCQQVHSLRGLRSRLRGTKQNNMLSCNNPLPSSPLLNRPAPIPLLVPPSAHLGLSSTPPPFP